jgi:hypothetical protein
MTHVKCGRTEEYDADFDLGEFASLLYARGLTGMAQAVEAT